MKNKKTISVIAVIMAVLMIVSLVVSVIPVTAYADEPDGLSELKAQKSQLSDQVKECKERLEALREQKSNVLEQKTALDEQKRLAGEQLKVIAKEIDKYSELIEEKAKEVDAAKNKEQRQLEKYRSRVRAMEENGGYNILAMVLQSDNFSDLLTAFDDMGEIMASDKTLQKQYMEAREETEEVKAQYEAEKAEFEANQAELREEQKEINSQIEEADKTLKELEQEIEKAVKEYEAAEAAEQAAAATIASMIAQFNAQKAAEQAQAKADAEQAASQVEEMNRANQEAVDAGQEPPYSQDQINQAQEAANTGGASGGDSGFMWPVPCSTRVTSRFGTRTDPFTGQTSVHNGIDIDGFGNDGAPVVAAASGTVVTASYDGAYGNYIIINHGGTSTVYAHMSGLAVSAGEYVSQGQTIGYLGDTGRATGTHLHFEVYVGDSRVDPASYFSGLTYYNC
ncbi:MAG: peptidoglycan DD-metalloendopeptidase family protein [Candidatus Limivicinus sp.]|nr:peptidoglycan DD-metalloendopeptidase family protein [Clostridiales bacterium]MDY3859460.1 peptidoglycan DD-metalloendopeptidase family protein [Candidatus Limivicinus sp.]